MVGILVSDECHLFEMKITSVFNETAKLDVFAQKTQQKRSGVRGVCLIRTVAASPLHKVE